MERAHARAHRAAPGEGADGELACAVAIIIVSGPASKPARGGRRGLAISSTPSSSDELGRHRARSCDTRACAPARGARLPAWSAAAPGGRCAKRRPTRGCNPGPRSGKDRRSDSEDVPVGPALDMIMILRDRCSVPVTRMALEPSRGHISSI
eukprot:scaffold604_cov384-Prasinococcus_capsulatus_cf.AAC.8